MTPAIRPIDAAIVLVYLAGVVLFGVWLGRGQRGLADYLLGGRSIPWWAVLVSIIATETSTVTFLSVPGLAYDPRQGNLTFLQLALGLIAGRFVVVLLFMPHYFRGEMFTAYEVLHRRFGGATKQTASALFLVTRNLADGLRLYLTAIVLQQMTGLGPTAAIVLVGAVPIVYTYAGGMKSVVWNDCVQFAVYILGALLAGAVIVASLPGGWEQLWRFGQEQGKFRIFDFSFDPAERFTFWSGLIGGIFLAMATHGTDQLMVQRYLAARSRKEASRALAASGFLIFAQFALFLFLGIGLACYYQCYPPALAFARNDEVFARFIVERLPVGVVGVTLAAVFAAAIGVLSGSLNSSANTAVNDLLLPRYKAPPSPDRLVRLSRWLTVLFGLVQIAVAIGGQYLGARSVVDQVLAIASFVAGAILGVFFLGVLTRHVRQASALIGLAGGLAVTTAVVFGTPLAYPWYAVLGSSAVVAIGLVAEKMQPLKPREASVSEKSSSDEGMPDGCSTSLSR